MDDTQTMTIAGNVTTDAGRVNPWALADGLAADGFEVETVELLDPVATGAPERFRIVARYPTAWVLGWQKGHA